MENAAPSTFDQVVASSQEEFLKAISQPPFSSGESVERIHQYTGLRTLVDMLTAFDDAVPREVWATSIPYMNDTQEFEHARALFREALDALQNSNVHSIQPVVFDVLRQQIHSVNGRAVFCACYSAKGDDLNQWRGYADGGKGACVSFDLKAMQEAFPTFSGWVRYSSQDQRQLVDKVVVDLANAFQGVIASNDFSPVSSTAYYSLRLFLALIFAFLKHPKFEEEAEFRIVYLNNPNEGKLKMFFRTAGTRIVPYVKLTIQKEGKATALPLTGVTFAPGSKGENNRMATQGMLTQRGVAGISIVDSEIPFLPTS